MLALLVPGVGMGAGQASSAPTLTVIHSHLQDGTKQPDTNTVHGPGMG